MRICLAVVGFLASAGAAAAQECEALGLKSVYLTNLYCSELQSIMDENQTTRSVTEGENVDGVLDLAVEAVGFEPDIPPSRQE